jgi:hypothetical protein
MNLADSHYRTLETKGQEPIIRMEAIICRGIPEELHEVAKRNLNMALASKHEDRAGEKSGEDWRKELTKAENYMHRAVHGCWIGKAATVKESLTVGDTVELPSDLPECGGLRLRGTLISFPRHGDSEVLLQIGDAPKQYVYVPTYRLVKVPKETHAPMGQGRMVGDV